MCLTFSMEIKSTSYMIAFKALIWEMISLNTAPEKAPKNKISEIIITSEWEVSKNTDNF